METGDRPSTLLEWQAFFFRQYGRRNTLYLHDPLARTALLAVAIKDLQDAIRKRVSRAKLSIALARVLARIFCVAQHYQAIDIRVVQSFANKYLAGACSYCHHKPCVCKESWRPAPEKKTCETPFSWSLARCCEELNALYGEANREKGVDYAVTRLFSELGEALAAIMVPLSVYDQLDQQRSLQEISDELADLLAWLIALSILLNIDLEEATTRRFWPRCRECKRSPCECGAFCFKPLVWDRIDPYRKW